MSYNKIRRFKGPRGRILRPGLYIFNGGTATTFSLKTPAEMDIAGIELDVIYLKNEGAAAWTISGPVYDTGLVASIILAAGEKAILVPDNAHWVRM